MQEPDACLLDLSPGDLVLTEIRGPQEGTWGEWFELYNASGRELDLQGLRGTLERLKGSEVDGEAAVTFLVREPLAVQPEGYVVLGTLPLDTSRRPDVDYSINDDFRIEPEIVEASGGVIIPPEDENADPRTLFGSARLRLHSCEQEIDSFTYAGLPALGTLSFDGGLPPDAEANDDFCNRWCNDATPPPEDGSQTATGVPGTPGAPNLPCQGEPAC